MTVQVYGKAGCGKCEAAKDKLRRLGIRYEEHNLAYHVAHHENWRQDGSVDVMAAHALLDTMPLIKIGEEITDYPNAMKKLKSLGTSSTVAPLARVAS
jgi:glutaredoxin